MQHRRLIKYLIMLHHRQNLINDFLQNRGGTIETITKDTLLQVN